MKIIEEHIGGLPITLELRTLPFSGYPSRLALSASLNLTNEEIMMFLMRHLWVIRFFICEGYTLGVSLSVLYQVFKKRDSEDGVLE